MGVETKSVGFLIDELITTNLKCYMAQEGIQNKNLSVEKRLEAAINAQQLNKRRNELIRAIDTILGYNETTVTEKTY